MSGERFDWDAMGLHPMGLYPELEEIAKVMLPGYLERHLGIRVGELERRFVGAEGREVEINPSASRAAAEREILPSLAK